MLPPLHRLSLRDDVPTDSPFDVLSQEEIDELIDAIVDATDPCEEALQAFCRSYPSANVHQTCERYFEALCRTPPVAGNPAAQLVPFLCHNGAYNPYDSGPRYQWRRQFAMFCGIQWGMYANSRKTRALGTLRQLGDPQWIEIPANAFTGMNVDLDKLPDNIIRIRREAFQACPAITRMRLPTNLERIGDFAFNSCAGLTSLDVPDRVTFIGHHAFAFCRALTTVSLPQNVPLFDVASLPLPTPPPPQFTVLPSELFSHCSSLQTIVIPNTVNVIGSGAFRRCTALQTLTIPDSVEEIIHEAFKHCDSLQQLQLPNNPQFQTIPIGLCQGCHALESIAFPPNIYMIHEDAFRDCRSLREVRIPESVMIIGERAFKGCTNLQRLYLPFHDGQGRMEWRAIEDCPEIRVFRGVFEVANAYMRYGLRDNTLTY